MSSGSHAHVADLITRQREAQHAAFEKQKAELARSGAKPVVVDLASKFVTGAASAVEAQFSAVAVGLMSSEQLRAAREEAERAVRMAAVTGGSAGAAGAVKKPGAAAAAAGAAAKAGEKRRKPVLSFMEDEEDEDRQPPPPTRAGASATSQSGGSTNVGGGTSEATAADGGTGAAENGDSTRLSAARPRLVESDSKTVDAPSTGTRAAGEALEAAAAHGAAQTNGVAAPARKLGKDPTIATDFLPDMDRDQRTAELREKLREEWIKQQELVKQEKIEIVYSYWDGTGHRRTISVPKGTTIGRFLEWVRQDLTADFPQMRTLTAENLMYVKEDLIIPHTYTFYDLIITKARGKSGPLFQFGVHDDIRLRHDARIEKDESHPGKIVERRWYERNKHIFPCSRWEIYDPSIQREGYTTHGQEVVATK